MPQRLAMLPQAGPAPAPGFGAPGGLDVNSYVQLEVLQQLRRLSRRRDSSGSEASSAGDERDTSSSKLRNVLVEFFLIHSASGGSVRPHPPTHPHKL